LYSYESTNAAGQPNPNKKVNILNKRVAYPLGQSTAGSGGMNPMLPPSTITAPLPPSGPVIPGGATLNPPSVVTTNEETPVDKEKTLIIVRKIFQNVLEEKSAELQVNLTVD